MGYDELYQEWHRNLGHREWRVTVSMYGYGRSEDAADGLLEAFIQKHPEGGPVISQNAETGHTAVTFVVAASNPKHAAQLAEVIFIEGVSLSGLPPIDWGGFEIVPVIDDEESASEDRPALSV